MTSRLKLQPRGMPRTIPFAWSLLGAKPLNMDIRIPDDKFTPSEIERIREAFPESKVSVYTWP